MDLVIGVMAQGRRHVSGKGDADGSSIFRIASISKVLTSLALAHLVQRGTVRLDDTAQEHLPGFDLPAWDGEPIRVKHLATHVSGLRDPYYRGDDGTLGGFASALRGVRLASRPGDEYSYSNVGASLLGNLLAVVTEMPFGELVDELVCRPLGLKDTVLELNPQQAERLRQGHDENRRPTQTPILPLHAGSGGFYGTANDLLTLLDAHMAPEPPLAFAMVQQTWLSRDNGSAMGLGWQIGPLPGTNAQLVWHNGSLPGYRSYLGFVPRPGCGVVALTNSSRPADDQARGILTKLVSDKDLFEGG